MTKTILERLRDPEGESIQVNLIGVAGSGMSGLASLLMAMGHRVSGSDRVDTVETQRLESAGLTMSAQTPESVNGAELVIYSSAIKPGNPAYDSAVAQGIPMVRRAEALAAIMDQRKGIIIGGTHGKTTTSSMAAHVLRIGDLRPSHYVGAEIPLLGTNAHWETDTDYMVAEGDESDGTLALFRPEHAIILNIEEEHLDFYENIDAINKVFWTLLDQTRGFFLYCGEDPGAVAVCAKYPQALSFGWRRELDYCAVEVQENGGSSTFKVLRKGEELGSLELGIPGRHNILNALSVIGLGTELGIPFEKIAEAMQCFRGARRRFERKYESANYRIFDDYGHHPTEICATLQTASSLNPKRLMCVFQPHRYSRTQLLRDSFGVCFDAVDELMVTDVYAASEKPIPGISGNTICEAVQELGTDPKVSFTPTKQEARLAMGNRIQPGDLLISLGAGDVHEVTTAIAKDLAVLEAIGEAMDDPEATLKLYEPMSRHTTMLVGGPAQFWVEPRTIEGFARLVAYCNAQDIPLRVVGRGSNLLIRDGGIPGVVVHPVKGDFEKVEVRDDLIHTGVGARYKRLTSAAQSAGIAGFEWMEGIPGNVGGGIRMNAGAMGVETFDQVVSVKYVNPKGEILEKAAEQIDFHYRNVPEFTENYVVSAIFKGSAGTSVEIQEKIEECKQHRKSSQPIGASAGCIFKNPGPCGAGQLIDELGLKNFAVGNARVSDVHANFIVNDGNATATEVLELIGKIQERAREQRGIELDTEVQILGSDQPF